jgi:hypothetical protein
VWVAWETLLIVVGVGTGHGLIMRFVRHGLEGFRRMG